MLVITPHRGNGDTIARMLTWPGARMHTMLSHACTHYSDATLSHAYIILGPFCRYMLTNMLAMSHYCLCCNKRVTTRHLWTNPQLWMWFQHSTCCCNNKVWYEPSFQCSIVILWSPQNSLGLSYCTANAYFFFLAASCRLMNKNNESELKTRENIVVGRHSQREIRRAAGAGKFSSFQPTFAFLEFGCEGGFGRWAERPCYVSPCSFLSTFLPFILWKLLRIWSRLHGWMIGKKDRRSLRRWRLCLFSHPPGIGSP